MIIQTVFKTTISRHRTIGRLAKRYGTKCHYCETQLEHPVFEFLPNPLNYKGKVSKKSIHYQAPRYAQFDHKKPKSQGGLRIYENGVIVCCFCNSRRRDQDFKKFKEFVKQNLKDPNSEWCKREI